MSYIGLSIGLVIGLCDVHGKIDISQVSEGDLTDEEKADLNFLALILREQWFKTGVNDCGNIGFVKVDPNTLIVLQSGLRWHSASFAAEVVLS
jgi:hypothetical protein